MWVTSTVETGSEDQAGTMFMTAYDGFGSYLEMTWTLGSKLCLVTERRGVSGPWYEALASLTIWDAEAMAQRMPKATAHWLQQHGAHASMQSLSLKSLDYFNEVLNFLETGVPTAKR